MKTSESIKEIAVALNKLQSELQTVSKDSKGYNYKYADYASIWNILREPLTKNGLSVVQDATSSDDGVSVTTTLIHTSGEWMSFGPLLVPMGKRDAHSTGSSITYARRYSLSAAVGVVPDDDDGVLAQKSAPHEESKEQPKVTVGQFLEKYGQKYDRNGLIEYITELSKLTDEQTILRKAMANEAGFSKGFEEWLQQKEQSER